MGKLKKYCRERGIRFMGDIPIYVAHDSADVWAHPELFYLDDEGSPTVVSGVPPDYFSATGQLWGNPIYRWELLAADGYKWWIERFARFVCAFRDGATGSFPRLRSVLGGSRRRADGHERTLGKRAGRRFFSALQKAFGELPIVAENLGVIHSAGRETAATIWFARHESFAICVWQ